MRPILLTGGAVVGPDGIIQSAQVLFDSKQILAVGPLCDRRGAEVVRVDGSVIMPGFIDSHIHGETPMWESGVVVGAIAQGVTSVILGQDGCSWAPGTDRVLTFMNGYFGAVNGVPRERVDNSLTVEQLLTGLESKAIQNFAYLAPHGNIRMMVSPAAQTPLRGEDLRSACRELSQAISDGAIGMSSGFDYVPSAYGDEIELSGLCKVLSEFNLPYVSHLRGYDSSLKEGLDELIRVGAAGGVRVHASHLRGKYEDLMQCFAEANKMGVELTYDMYPYRASSTTLLSLLLPVSQQSPSLRKMLGVLANKATYNTLLKTEGLETKLRSMRLSYVGSIEHKHLEGQYLSDAAERRNEPILAFAIHLLLRSNLQVGVVDYSHGTQKGDLDDIILDDRHCGGSDGIYQGSFPHPRGCGAFTRMLRRYNDLGPDGLLTATRHLSGNSARVFRISNRGSLTPGHAADIVVWRMDRLVDAASETTPRALASGVEKVYINGVLAWSEGKLTGAKPGQLLRPK